MKNIRKFNEYFDTEDLKSMDEIGYLSGDVEDELKSKIKEVESGENPLFSNLSDELKKVANRLTFEIPYLNKMELRTDGKKNLVYSNIIENEDEGNKLRSYCGIQITVNKDGSLIPHIKCEVEVNGKNIYDDTSYEPIMDMDELLSLLKGKYLSILNKWDKYNKSTISKMFFGEKGGSGFNLRSN